jgi:hypothetical protein
MQEPCLSSIMQNKLGWYLYGLLVILQHGLGVMELIHWPKGLERGSDEPPDRDTETSPCTW